MEIFGLAALGLIGGELLKYGKIMSAGGVMHRAALPAQLPPPIMLWRAPGPATSENRGACVKPPLPRLNLDFLLL